MKLVIIAFSGALFGAGLALSGMTNPARVIGFLDFFGDWDPTLAFVMGGAVGVFLLGQVLLRRRPNLQCLLPDTSADPLDRRMLVGSAIFGVGWGLGGFCPGPAIANLGLARPEALIFVPLMLLGMFLAQRSFGLDG